MGIITEYLDAFPVQETVLQLRRDEEALLTKPNLGPVKLLNHDPLTVVHFPTQYVPKKFSPPQGVYESDHLRLEWQQMNFRQPFYHRNADVDELSYQVCGERTLMTEYGTVELRPGDFSRIPVGVAHDNYGREEIHLLFYIPAPVFECVPASKVAGMAMPPFPGWKAKEIAEVMTECLGGPECDIAVSNVDENLLLEHARGIDPREYIKVLRSNENSNSGGQIIWLYKSSHVWLGVSQTPTGDRKIYRRHRRADEIQCQIKGIRTLITQRGTVQLAPGDFVNIPNGVAFTEICQDPCIYISVLTRYPISAKPPVAKTAEMLTWEKTVELKTKY